MLVTNLITWFSGWVFCPGGGGFKEAAQDAVVFHALVGTGSLDDPAHDDHRTQNAIGLKEQVE